MSAGSTGERRLRAILHEPLLHFALGGALLFLAYYHYAPRPSPAASKDIVITEANLASFRSELQQLYQRPPNQVELNELIEDYVHTEVLYREALALGLDKGDIVVRRRMEQKMRFLIEGTTRLPPVTDVELNAWLETHRADFDEPARVRFSQVFVSRELRGDGSDAVAEKLRADLVARSATPEQAAETGDAFPAGFDFDLLSERELVRYFGPDFAAAVMTLPEGSWSQPLTSTYGVHLVWVREQVPTQHVTLDAVRERVRYAFDQERQQHANDARFAELRSHYTIELPHASMASQP